MSAVLCYQAECGVGHVQPLESTWGTEWWLEEPRAVPLGPPGALQTVAQSVSLSAEVNGSIEWREDG
jgi:hypothetical protein